MQINDKSRIQTKVGRKHSLQRMTKAMIVFPVTNATSNKGFSYCVMGIGVKHKLISGMSVCVNHSIGETTMFPDVYYQTLQSYPIWRMPLEMGYILLVGLRIWCRKAMSLRSCLLYTSPSPRD